MRCWLIGTMAALFASITMGQTTGPEYAPISVAHVASGAHRNDKLPLVMIGRILTQTAPGPEQDAEREAYHHSFRDNQLGIDSVNDENAKSFANSQLLDLPAVANDTIALALATPFGKSEVTPTVTKQGDRLVLNLKWWKPNEANNRGKSVIGQRVQMIYLPSLPAGVYRLQVQWQTMTEDDLAKGSGWTLTDSKVGEMPFEIYAKDPAPSKSVLPVMFFDALKATAIPEADAKSQEQTPWQMTARRFKPVLEAPALQVGTFVPDTFFRGDPSLVLEPSALPKLDPPKSGQSTYAVILAPKLNYSVEWASIHSVEWKGLNATVNCFLWAVSGRHTTTSLPTNPLLVVRLNPPTYIPAGAPTPPGHYTVTVVYRRLIAPWEGGWYATSDQTIETKSSAFDVR